LLTEIVAIHLLVDEAYPKRKEKKMWQLRIDLFVTYMLVGKVTAVDGHK
jgi:hypothetical protein